jgi:hypothetical protein
MVCLTLLLSLVDTGGQLAPFHAASVIAFQAKRRSTIELTGSESGAAAELRPPCSRDIVNDGHRTKWRSKPVSLQPAFSMNHRVYIVRPNLKGQLIPAEVWVATP